MTYETLTAVFGWMTVLNFAFLATAALALLVMRDWATSLHARLFGITEEAVLTAYFSFLSRFKVLAIVFSLVPYLALRLAA